MEKVCKYDKDANILHIFYVDVRSDGHLKTVALPVWKNGECQEAYSRAGVDWVTKSSHLCAGTKIKDGNGQDKISKDTCNVSYTYTLANLFANDRILQYLNTGGFRVCLIYSV